MILIFMKHTKAGEHHGMLSGLLDFGVGSCEMKHYACW